MKHAAHFSTQSCLPDAPLPMPKQTLERRRSLIESIRASLWPFAGR
jgi:hypothetical protein